MKKPIRTTLLIAIALLICMSSLISCDEIGGILTTTPQTTPAETISNEPNNTESNASETNAPETNAPETNAPETNAPETNAPEPFPSIETIVVNPLTNNKISIDKITHTSTTIDAAVSKVYNGNITKDGQKDVYSFKAPRDGVYRLDLSNVKASMKVGVYVFDKLGDCVKGDNSMENNDGLTVSLKANETYEIQVREYEYSKSSETLGSYTLTIWQQKPTVDLKTNTIIVDSTEYQDQRNKYIFTPSESGVYRFDLSKMKSGVEVGIYVFDELEECVGGDNSMENKDGLTVSLKANETYEVQVREYEYSYSSTTLGSYTLTIWSQKPTVDLKTNTIIVDSTEYQDQRNKYIFTPSESGVYRFDLSNMKSGVEVAIYVFDELEECVGGDNSMENKDGLTVKLNANETYEIQVREYEYSTSSGTLGDYTLTIWKQKPAVDVTSKVQIKDSIQYTDQKNVYNFTADVVGTQTVKITGLDSSTSVKIYVYDELDDVVASDTSFKNNESITLKNLEIGTNYRIVVVYYTGTGNYTLTIE